MTGLEMSEDDLQLISVSPLYLIRLSQSHITFRRPELEALAAHFNVDLIFRSYDEESPFCIISFASLQSQTLTPSQCHSLAKDLISQSILAKSVHELYATASTYPHLHAAVKALPQSTWADYADVSFKFTLDIYAGTRSMAVQRKIIEEFSFLPFHGRIRMKGADEKFVVCEEWALLTPTEQGIVNRQVHSGSELQAHVPTNGEAKTQIVEPTQVDNAEIQASLMNRQPKRLFFARYLGSSRRDLIDKHDLKKRPYISTTSMDAELALVTANLALAAPGKLFLDPFTGTGGFMVAAAELGALPLGSDIDGRSFRGRSTTYHLEKGVGANFKKYGITANWGDCLTADLTNTPLRIPGRSGCRGRWLDGVICDPPYGIREGLKVLGRRPTEANTTNGRTVHDGPYFVDGVPSHTLPDFIAPKRPYSFNRMLGDILDFAARTLVDGGRLAFWMPVANDADEEFPVPRHEMLELKASCIQVFNKWSRRLLVYRRLNGEVDVDVLDTMAALTVQSTEGRKADDLNQFRRMYFQGFQTPSPRDSVPKSDHLKPQP